MKCINKSFVSVLSSVILSVILTGCSGYSFRDAYDYDSRLSAFSYSLAGSDTASPFAKNLCVVSSDNITAGTELTGVKAAGLFDTTSNGTLYAVNVHERLAPVSLTKVMTALIALKYGHTDDVITASANVGKIESGAQMVGLKEGDRLTLEQALYALLVYSGNDAGVAIAEYLSGSVDEFCDLMNDEALKLGATNTHFANPHGLTNDDHYTTAYDLYLIFNEAMKYDKFREIIGTAEYTTVYSDRDGKSKDMDIKNSNLYLTGEKTAPSNVTLIGGKTGTTNAAGSCLILLSDGPGGNRYISVILKADDKDILYDRMTKLIEQVP